MLDFNYFDEITLHPELSQYISLSTYGAILRHPLVFAVPYFPEQNKIVNRQLEYKKKAVSSALEKQNYNQYIWLHERPFRLNAFLAIQDHLDDVTYSSLLAEVWIDSENIWQYQRQWISILNDTRFSSQHFMVPEEYDFFRSLPSRFTIYRGCDRKNRSGLSWTLDRKKALWFAARFEGNVLLEKTVCKKSVLAYVSRRSESEIILRKPPKIYKRCED